MCVFHLALKFAYNGTHFFGFQRQPEVRTVEGDIRKALDDLEREVIGKEGHDLRYSYASRTDRGVSAIGNVLEYRSPIEPVKLIGFLNSRLDHIHFHGYTFIQEINDPFLMDHDELMVKGTEQPTERDPEDPIAKGRNDQRGIDSGHPTTMNSEDFGCTGNGKHFNPRYARERWYRYFAPLIRIDDGKEKRVGIHMKGKPKDFDLIRALGIAEMFVGTHDFSSFARIESGKDPVRTLSSIHVQTRDLVKGLPPFLVIDIKGESFLWMMVRYLVGAIIEAGTGRLENESISEWLEHPKVAQKGSTPVAPENLVLMDVVYDGMDFIHVTEPTSDYFDQAGNALAGLEVWKGIFGDRDLR